jgi:hypothetical protein
MIHLIDHDSAARALCESLMQMKELLARHRAELRIGHSREDYWARIEPVIRASSTPNILEPVTNPFLDLH